MYILCIEDSQKLVQILLHLRPPYLGPFSTGGAHFLGEGGGDDFGTPHNISIENKG